MEKIKYRPIRPEDYEIVGAIIGRAFGLSHYVSSSEALTCFQRQYVYSCLAEATYTQVAEKEGKVVGVIMGHADKHLRGWKHLCFGIKTLYYSLKFTFLCRNDKAQIQDYLQLHGLYNRLSEKHRGEFDGVLTLFAVEKECRGYGVGSHLLSGLLDALRSWNVKEIYLYTDDTCNTGFYLHHGFRPLEAETLTMTRDQKPFSMEVYLYGYHM